MVISRSVRSWMPWMIVIMPITAATPMMTPRRVRNARSLCARSDSPAILRLDTSRFWERLSIRVRCPMRIAGLPYLLVAQRFDRAHPRRAEGGQEAEREADQAREPERERDHPGRHAHRERSEVRDERGGAGRDRHTHHPAERAQDHRLGQELAEDGPLA